MASFVVIEPPLRDAADRAVLVRDGFHFLAFLLPPVWFAWHRMWREAIAVLVIGLAVSGFGAALGAAVAANVLSFLIALYVGLEAPALRVAALRRADWRVWGVVVARNADEAELRYGADRADTTGSSMLAPWASISPRAVRSGGPALGLLGYPGRP